eukprot:scaffold100026_cov16-Tisochrysis_lutea.AAC.1
MSNFEDLRSCSPVWMPREQHHNLPVPCCSLTYATSERCQDLRAYQSKLAARHLHHTSFPTSHVTLSPCRSTEDELTMITFNVQELQGISPLLLTLVGGEGCFYTLAGLEHVLKACEIKGSTFVGFLWGADWPLFLALWRGDGCHPRAGHGASAQGLCQGIQARAQEGAAAALHADATYGMQRCVQSAGCAAMHECCSANCAPFLSSFTKRAHVYTVV